MSALPPSIQTILQHDIPVLARALTLQAAEARIEVQMLLQRVLTVSRAYLLAHAERILDDAQYAQYQVLLQRRMKGEPMAYILGEREFFGLNFKVTPATLIPRPDTELLVELALQHLRKDQPNYILDLGTGSGAIALAVAYSAPGAKVTACDFSPAALVVATENAATLKIPNVEFIESHWYDNFAGRKFSMIVSNPPYINADDPHLALGDVRFEPATALVAGKDGLDDIRLIITGAQSHLLPGGWLMLEHGYDQAGRVRELLQQAGFNEIFSASDLAGIERVSGGMLNI